VPCDDLDTLRADAAALRARLEDAAVTGVERQELSEGLLRIENRIERLEDRMDQRLLELEASVNRMKGAASLAKVALGLVGIQTLAAFLVFLGNAR